MFRREGLHKERLEAIIDHVVREADPEAHAFVNIAASKANQSTDLFQSKD